MVIMKLDDRLESNSCKEMKKISKNNRGITLIALMITVIVLLILAGVTLSLTLRGKRNI